MSRGLGGGLVYSVEDGAAPRLFGWPGAAPQSARLCSFLVFVSFVFFWLFVNLYLLRLLFMIVSIVLFSLFNTVHPRRALPNTRPKACNLQEV